MNNFLFIFLISYSIFGCFILIGFYFQFKKEKKNLNETSNLINLNQLTVIIPFRNEEENLPFLIQSIQNQTCYPFHFLFVDDHSIDDGSKLIEKLNEPIKYTVLHSPAEIEGKKAVIRYAMQYIHTEFILTLDADVQFTSNYFSSLQLLTKKDLLILPVIMEGKKWKEKLFELDYAFSNSLNTSIAGLIRPFVASGANLLFRKDIFLEYDSYNQHKNISSGDDVFLLRDFQKNKCDVEIVTSLSNAVYTKTPQTLKSFIEQRLRWIGKSHKVNDILSNILAIIAGSVHLLFIIGVIHFIQSKDWTHLGKFFIFKSGLEMIMNYPYFKKIKRIETWFLIPISSIIYPFYIIVLLFLSISFQPKWKGRTIYK